MFSIIESINQDALCLFKRARHVANIEDKPNGERVAYCIKYDDGETVQDGPVRTVMASRNMDRDKAATYIANVLDLDL